MARKFLWIVAILIMLVIAVSFALSLFQKQLSELAFVPRGGFERPAALPANAYANPAMWLQRPGKQDLVRWLPRKFDGEDADALNAAVFFVHPTSYLAKAHWNGPVGDRESLDRTKLFVRAMASPFARAGDVWAPRYRQAAFGAFLTDRPERDRALALAYLDVLAAFDRFVTEAGPDRPILLAGHSQGSLHLLHLLKDRVAGKPIARRIVAAYVVGWPVSVEADIPATGLTACEKPAQTGCVLSWQSFAEPADHKDITNIFGRETGLTGKPRRKTQMLCTNPLTGTAGGTAPASANQGTLKPDGKLEQADMVKALVPARCDANGFLLIGAGPEIGPFVLPGNNYHVYDIPLFWRNVRADAERRTRAMVAK